MISLPLFYTVVSDSSNRPSKEESFLEDKCRALRKWKDATSNESYSAPSSIFRCLLLRKEEETLDGVSPVSLGESLKKPFSTTREFSSSHSKISSDGSLLPCERSTTEKELSEKTEQSAVSPSTLLAQRAQRGLQRRDVLHQRLAKKTTKDKAAVGSSSCKVEKMPFCSTDAFPVKGVAHVPIAPSHWSKRPFSAMSSASWQVFREEVGISVEIVRPRHVSATSASSSSSVSSSITLATEHKAPTPVRCWGEAELPFNLGMIVSKMYDFPTAIQSQCVPILLQTKSLSSTVVEERCAGKLNLLAVSETGGGKTAAYLIPAITDILVHRPKLAHNHDLISLGPFVLIAVPTRELAEQVYGEAQKIIQGNALSLENKLTIANLEKEQQERLATCVSPEEKEMMINQYKKNHNLLEEIQIVKVVGGENMDLQHEKLSFGAHIVIGTIGQLYTLLEARLLSLGNTQMIVVDEADRMLEENNKGYLDAVLRYAPPREARQTAFFTATLTAKCERMVRDYFSPQRGYIVVRTPNCCPTVRQEFEVFSSFFSTLPQMTASPKNASRSGTYDVTSENARYKSGASFSPARDGPPNSTEDGGGDEECLNRTAATLAHNGVHPFKFARLITWLLYAPSPVIVFVNERKTCDVLQDALLAEEARLRREFPDSVSLQAVMEECPKGMQFLTSSAEQKCTTTAPRLSRMSSSNSSFSPSISLANLSSVAVVHSENSQEERKRLVQLFQRGERRVLITTDLLARGLDVPGVSLVLNYDVPWPRAGNRCRKKAKREPQNGEEDLRHADFLKERSDIDEEAVALYIHRIGRTGRAGAHGITVSFLCLPEKVLEEFALHQHDSKWSGSSDREARSNTFSRSLGSEKGGDRGWDRLQWEKSVESSSRSGTEGDSDEDSEGREMHAKKRNRENGKKSSANALLPLPKKKFSDDLSFLPLLWKFLVSVVESNQSGGTKKLDAARLLRENRFARVYLPPLLSSFMQSEAEGQHYNAFVL